MLARQDTIALDPRHPYRDTAAAEAVDVLKSPPQHAPHLTDPRINRTSSKPRTLPISQNHPSSPSTMLFHRALSVSIFLLISGLATADQCAHKCIPGSKCPAKLENQSCCGTARETQVVRLSPFPIIPLHLSPLSPFHLMFTRSLLQPIQLGLVRLWEIVKSWELNLKLKVFAGLC